MSAGMKLENLDQAMKALERMDGKIAKKVLKKSMRASATRMREKIADATPVRTGELQAEMRKAPIRARKAPRDTIAVATALPESKELAIRAMVNEYGSVKRRMPPKRFIRRTVDENADIEHGRIAQDIRDGINKEARKS